MTNTSDVSWEVSQKIVFLFIIDQVNDISHTQLMNLCCESMYLDYFTFSQISQDMVDQDLAQSSVRKNELTLDAHGKPLERWDLTQKGKSSLSILLNNVPIEFLNYLNQLIQEKNLTPDLNNQYIGTYSPTERGDYETFLMLKEKNRVIFQLSLIMPDIKNCQRLLAHWEKNGEAIYLDFITNMRKF